MSITLPPVLAGPIVRRVEPRLFTVWIALSEPAAGTDSVEVKIWRGFQMSGPAAGAVVSGDPLVGSGSAPTRPFGKHLHIACVVVKIVAPAPPLDHGTIYSYDVTIKRSTGNQGLKSLGMLSDQPDAACTSRYAARRCTWLRDRPLADILHAAGEHRQSSDRARQLSPLEFGRLRCARVRRRHAHREFSES